MAVSRSRTRVVSMFIMSMCTLASRTLGFVRELLFVRYLGAKILSDAFLTAFSIPNTFYEIFVGGASGSTVLPFLLHIQHQYGAHTVNQVLTAFLVSMLGIISFVCLIIAKFPLSLLGFLVPGFIPEQIRITVVLLRIFLFFMLSSGATSILAEALRAKRYFFIPAMGQIIVNIAFITGLTSYGLWGIRITSVAYCVVVGGVLQCFVQLGTCWYAGYRPALPGRTTWRYVMGLLQRFFPCMITSGINEIALFIERQFASYLPVGSISLMTYASSIMRLPFGLLVYPLTTVIMPELAKAQRSPARVAFLMFEICKFILWIIVPLVVLLGWFSYDIFATLYGASKLSISALLVLRNLLLIKLCGLIFLSMNHVCLQIFYARHEVYLPTMVSLVTATWSIGATYMMYPRYGIYGIAVASVATMVVRTLLFVGLLHRRIRIGRYARRFKKFLARAVVQWLCIVPLWLLLVSCVRSFLRGFMLGVLTWYSDGIGLWLWVAPSVILLVAALWWTRHICGLRFYCMK
jgi:putative peptidoglycan lipid II flippase